jgi:hypothetical protein
VSATLAASRGTDLASAFPRGDDNSCPSGNRHSRTSPNGRRLGREGSASAPNRGRHHDILAGGAPTGDMVHGPREFNSQCTSHRAGCVAGVMYHYKTYPLSPLFSPKAINRSAGRGSCYDRRGSNPKQVPVNGQVAVAPSHSASASASTPAPAFLRPARCTR